MSDSPRSVGVHPSMWSCVGWQMRPSSSTVVKVLVGTVLLGAAAIVLGAYAGRPRTGCTDTPSGPTTGESCIWGPPRRPRMGVMAEMPARPGFLVAGIVGAVVIAAVAAVYLLWRRKPNHIEWAEFERRASVLRRSVQDQYNRDPNPGNEQLLRQLDAEYGQIASRYRPPPVSSPGR
ncbi:hypothetical protein AAFP35_17440 [Gordonia sp. CPCC 206044]|uniref:hypothetical protein n=1 Tax=Gordonia sp. CPCC 206044 TaxID=3140793 RepID=UPI003AF3B820